MGGTDLKLNVGCSDPRGIYEQPEWINIDASRFFRGMQSRRFCVADGCSLPFRDCQFDEVRAIHVLEHVPRDKHLAFLKEIRRVLTPEGFGLVEVPDFVTACAQIAKIASLLEDPNTPPAIVWEAIRIRTVGVYGKGRHEGDWHHWGFSTYGFELLCKDAGLLYSRESQMVSSHYRMEPVLLYRVWRD